MTTALRKRMIDAMVLRGVSLRTREEIGRLFAAARNLRGRAVLMTPYAAGLRVSELCALQLTDIESAADRMCLKVRAAKCSSASGRVISPAIA